MKKSKRTFVITLALTVLIIGAITGFAVYKVILLDRSNNDSIDKPIVENEQTNDSTEDSDIEAGTGEDSEAGVEVETEPEEDPEPVVTTITVSAAGDVTLGINQNHETQPWYSFHAEYDEKGETHFFGGVESVFAHDDMTIVNFEAVLTECTERVEKMWNLKGKPEYMRIMNIGSVEVAGFANNHCRDYGEQSFLDTIALFEEYNITYGAEEIVGVYETKGIRIGFVAVDGLLGESALNNARTGAAKLDEMGVNLKIVYIHWGVEGDYYPTQTQQEWGRYLVDMGYGLVLGSHPHVLQGIEIYNNAAIVYSLANFCFGGNRNPADKNTMIYQQTFTFVDGVLQDDLDIKVIPCTISSTDGRNDFRPTIHAGTARGAEILRLINTYSEPWGTVFDEEGKLIP